MSLRECSIFFLLSSIVIVPLMVPLTNGITDYFALKLLLLGLSALFAFIEKPKLKFAGTDKLVYTWFGYSVFTVLYGDFYTASLLMHVGFLVSYVMTFAVVRAISGTNSLGIYHLTFAIIFEFFLFYTLYGQSKSMNGGYVVGHLSILVLALQKNESALKKIVFSGIFFVWSGLRFFGVSALSLVSGARRLMLLGSIVIISLYLLTTAAVGTKYYTLLLGYRIAEPGFLVSTFSENPLLWIFGQGLGTDFFETKMGSKGFISHSGIFHNYYITLIFNTGLIGLCLFLYAFIHGLKTTKNPNNAIWLASVMIMISIDSHRDGIWLIFFLLAVQANSRGMSKELK